MTESGDQSNESHSPKAGPEGESDQVGYGNPPKHSQFKKGNKSGGRPKGAKNRKTIVKKVAYEKHTVTENGEKRQRTTWELIVLTLRNLAAQGNPKAFRMYERLLEQYEPQVQRQGGYVIVPAPITMEEFEQELEEHRQKMLREEGE